MSEGVSKQLRRHLQHPNVPGKLHRLENQKENVRFIGLWYLSVFCAGISWNDMQVIYVIWISLGFVALVQTVPCDFQPFLI